MSDGTDVTGGDLYYLWRAANVLLPEAQNAYDEQITAVHAIDGSPDQEKYGECHPMWTLLASELEMALFMTRGGLAMTSSALNRAVDAYTHVDGNHAKELTELGKDFEDKRNGEDPTKIKGLPSDYEGPNYDPRLAEELTS